MCTGLTRIRARAGVALARILLVASLLTSTSAVLAAEQWMTLGGLRVAVWSDSVAAEAEQPVIVFSHGFLACATQSRFLMEAFAKAGYIVFAPTHRDSICSVGERPWRPVFPLQDSMEWTDADFRDRAEDIRMLVEAIRVDDRLRTNVDVSRLGLVGHSLGGYTVLGLSGAWPSWNLPGVKAVLALAPYAQPFIAHEALGELSVPVMYQGGTLDFTTPALEKASGAYAQSPPPKYLVEFDLASHLAWTNIGLVAHDQIVFYSVAFMDTYVRSLSRDAELTTSARGVAHLRHAGVSAAKGKVLQEIDGVAPTSSVGD